MLYIKKHWKSGLLNIIIVLAVYQAVQFYHARNTPNGMAPPISGRLLDGQLFSLTAVKERPMLVHFWATWCGVCRLEQDSIDRLAKDFPVIAVASQSGTTQELINTVAQRGITVPVLPDEHGRLARAFGVNVYPTTFVVGKNNEIYDVEVGYTTEFGFRFRLWMASLIN